jgi:hypothetical protein
VIDRSIDKGSKLFRPEIRNTIVKNGPKNPISAIELPEGFPADFDEGVIPARSKKWPKYVEDVVVKNGRIAKKVSAESGWSSRAICLEFIAANFNPVRDSKQQLTRFVVTRTGAIEAVKVRSASQSHVVSVIRDVGSTQSMSEDLKKMGLRFSFPKPVGLIDYLISMVADKSAIVLDSFAGSGTSAHAVLGLNKQDGGNRRFILVQMPHESEGQRDRDENITRDLTRKRVELVVGGYTNAKSEAVVGLGGGFRYCRLDAPLFSVSGEINPDVRFAALARHVYFTEFLEPLPRERVPNSPLVGVCRGTGVYLLFNGILGDKSVGGGNVLTRAVLAKLPQHDGPKVVYANGCLLGDERLRREQITFRQTPYEIATT